MEQNPDITAKALGRATLPWVGRFSTGAQHIGVDSRRYPQYVQ